MGILVTNAKDKDINLKVVGMLDEMIQKLLEGADEDETFDAEMSNLLESRSLAEARMDFNRCEEIQRQILSLQDRWLSRLRGKMEEATKRRDYKNAQSIK